MFMSGSRSRASHKAWNSNFADKPALTAFDKYGYKRGAVLGVQVKAHRVIFAMYHGYWPTEIDHINHNRSDNKISNLRNVSRQQNCRNLSISKNNTSGVIGVYWTKARNIWRAQINTNGKHIHLGYFEDKIDAIAARKEAESKYGFHKNHGDIR